MYRDGALKSIWQADITLTRNHTWNKKTYDVAIAGGGITGISCAVSLQARGLNCILLEAENAGFGTTGGTTAHLNTFFDVSYDQVIRDFGLNEARLLAQCGKEAITHIRQMVHQHNIECNFEEKTAFLFALDEAQAKELSGVADSSMDAGIEMHDCTSIPFPIPFRKAVAIPGQAQFHPVRYINGLREVFIKGGGTFIEACRVQDYTDQSGQLLISTTLGPVSARHLIYATHTPPGVNLIHFRNVPWRSYAIAVKLEDGQYPDALGYDMQDPYHYYRSQVINGEQYLIAGGEDHKTGHEPDTGKCFQQLEAYVRNYFNVKEVPYAWSSQYFEPADGLPYIGRMPGTPDNVYVATGYNGNGMIFGTASARVLSDLISDGASIYEDLFNPRRIKPIAGFKTFVSHNATVVASFVKDKLQTDAITTLHELDRGEGRVVQYEGHTYALYKDDEGLVHALSSTCPHAQCTVHWNTAEKTWDCPCHGSRFGINGNVLNAPAVQNLKSISLHKGI